MTERIARGVGALLLATLVAAFVGSMLAVRVGLAERPIDLGGTIERYDRDAIVVLTAAGLRVVRLTPGTRITDVDRAADPRALRPGRFVAVAGDRRGLALVASRMIVWGAEQ